MTISGAEAAVTETRAVGPHNGFISLRGVAVAANGDIILSVLRPDSVVNPQVYTVELLNASSVANPTEVFEIDPNRKQLATQPSHRGHRGGR